MILDDCPGVHESAVVGTPDLDFGENVVAFVVADGTTKVDSEGLTAEMQTKLAGFKVPRSIVFIDELPRNSMGKVQKSVLRKID